MVKTKKTIRPNYDHHWIVFGNTIICSETGAKFEKLSQAIYYTSPTRTSDRFVVYEGVKEDTEKIFDALAERLRAIYLP